MLIILVIFILHTVYKNCLTQHRRFTGVLHNKGCTNSIAADYLGKRKENNDEEKRFISSLFAIIEPIEKFHVCH